MLRTKIEAYIKTATENAEFEYPRNAMISRPEVSFGDFASNVALVLAKETGKKPADIAEAIKGELQKANHSEIQSIEVAGIGFINIFITEKCLLTNTKRAIEDDNFGHHNKLKNKKIVLEHTDPNLFKPMHIGHFLNNSIGESIARILENMGGEVIRVSYQGDIGPNIAKAIWGLLKDEEVNDIEQMGKAYARGDEAYKKSPASKKEIDEINILLNKDLSHLEGKVGEIYQKGAAISTEHFKSVSKILSTKFKHNFLESEMVEEGCAFIKENKEKFFEESEGAIVFRGEKYGLHTRVFITSHNTPTYETKEIGLFLKKQKKFKPDLSIIITSNEQKGHFSVLQKLFALFDAKGADKLKVLFHSHLRLESGKMSSREGNVIAVLPFIQSLTEEVIEKMKANNRTANKDVARKIAITSFRYMALRQEVSKDILFDSKRAISFKGDTGAYLLYTLVRTHSLLKNQKIDGDIYYNERIVKRINQFEEITYDVHKFYAPHLITQYLTTLAGEFNNWYEKERILNEENTNEKLMLVFATQKVLQRGMFLLGMPTVKEM